MREPGMKIEMVKFYCDPETGEPYDPPLWCVAFTDVHPVDGHEYGIATYIGQEERPQEGEELYDWAVYYGKRALAQYILDNPEGKPK